MNHRHIKRLRRQIKEYTSKPIALAQNIQAEQALLSAVLADGDRDFQAFYDAIRVGVTPESFDFLSNTLHGDMWECITVIVEGVQHLNAATLTEQMRRTASWNEDVPGYIEGLIRSDVDPAQAAQHAQLVVNDAVRRTAQVEGLMMTHELPKQDMGYLQTTLQRMTESSMSQIATITGITSKAMTVEYLEQAQRLQHAENIAGFDLGIADLDSALGGGMSNGLLYYVGGPEKAGKTKIATWVCTKLMERHNATVNWCSVEMSTHETTSQFLSCLSGLSAKDLQQTKPVRRDRETDDEYSNRCFAQMGKALQAASVFGEFDFQSVYLGTETSIIDIEAWIRMRVQEAGHTKESTRPFALVIDYVQDINPGIRTTSTEEAIRLVSRKLRDIAKDLNVMVIGIFHTNREAQRSGRPQAHHVHGSSQLAKDASYLILLNRPGDDDPDWRSYMEFIIARTRHGSRGEVLLNASLGNNQFKPWIGPKWQPPQNQNQRGRR